MIPGGFHSLHEIKGVLESSNLALKETFQHLLIKQTDNRNCIFQIDSVAMHTH